LLAAAATEAAMNTYARETFIFVVLYVYTIVAARQIYLYI